MSYIQDGKSIASTAEEMATMEDVVSDFFKTSAMASVFPADSSRDKPKIEYTETIHNGVFEIRLASTSNSEDCIVFSQPNNGGSSRRNTLRSAFLTMVFKAAIFGTLKTPPEQAGTV